MSDAFRKVRTGDDLVVPARAYNAFIDAAEDHRRRQRRQGQQARPEIRDSGVVLIRNLLGADRNRFEVLGMDAFIISPADNLEAFKNRVALDGSAPASGDRHEFAVLLEPVADGQIGRAMVSGVCPARVDVVDEEHRYAEAVYGSAILRSCPSGPARILWKEAGTGPVWAVVALGSPAGLAPLWVKATDNWTEPVGGGIPYVNGYACRDALGNGVDTSRLLSVQLPRSPGRDPNVRAGQVIGTSVDPAGVRTCVTGYLDDAIGTVKLWSGDLADIPAGWRLHADLAGRFPVGYQAGHADYGTPGATGGAATHDHTGSTGSASPDIEDYVQVGCMYVSHYLEPHSHTIDTKDHRPPYAVVAFIERYS